MADTDHSIYDPLTIKQIAALPDYEREWRLKYVQHLTPEQEVELEKEIPNAIRAEFEQIAGKRVNRQVYFIQSSSGAIKIGVASNPVQRLRTLQTAHAEPLTLLCAVLGGAMCEERYHYQFRDHRLIGEWFSPAPELLAEIERLTTCAE